MASRAACFQSLPSQVICSDSFMISLIHASRLSPCCISYHRRSLAMTGLVVLLMASRTFSTPASQVSAGIMRRHSIGGTARGSARISGMWSMLTIAWCVSRSSISSPPAMQNMSHMMSARSAVIPVMFSHFRNLLHYLSNESSVCSGQSGSAFHSSGLRCAANVARAAILVCLQLASVDLVLKLALDRLDVESNPCQQCLLVGSMRELIPASAGSSGWTQLLMCGPLGSVAPTSNSLPGWRHLGRTDPGNFDTLRCPLHHRLAW